MDGRENIAEISGQLEKILAAANKIQETAYTLASKFEPETMAELISASAQLEIMCAQVAKALTGPIG